MTCYPFNDLRFTHEETQSFLAKVIGYPLSEKDMLFFEKNIEGWIAGIQMAWIASHRWKESFDLLQRLSVEAEAGKRFGRLLKINILRTLSMDALGRREEALDKLENCLEFARLEGYFRVFLDLGTPSRDSDEGVNPWRKADRKMADGGASGLRRFPFISFLTIFSRV